MITTRFRKVVLVGVLFFIMIGILGAASSSHTNALGGVLIPDPSRPPTPPIPVIQQQTLENCVRNNGFMAPGVIQQPVFAVWLAVAQSALDPSATPATQTITVPSGTTSIPMQYDYAGAVCRTDNGTTDTTSKIFNASVSGGASVPGLVGQQLDIPFLNVFFPGCVTTRGCYLRDSKPFSLNIPGGIKTSTTFNITVHEAAINRYTNGRYQCVGGSTPFTSAGNFAPCTQGSAALSIRVNVTPKPNHAPTLSYSYVCNSAGSSITPVFGDQDGPSGATQARLIMPNSTMILPQSASGKPISTSAYTSFASATFTLEVADVLPGGAANSTNWDTANAKQITLGPCGGSGLTCNGVTTDPAIPEPGTNFSLVVSYTYSGSNPPNPSSQTLHVSGPGFDNNWNGGSLSPKFTQTSAAGGTLTLTLVGGLNVPNAGSYNVSWAVTVGAVSKTCVGSTSGDGTPGNPLCTVPGSCGGVFTSAFKPYFQVYNGDISAGGGIPTITNAGIADCTVPGNPEAGIIGWNGESPPWSGAGVQYGARAVKNIYDFASSYSVTSGTGRPVALSFSNVGANAGSGNYGGNYGASSPGCDSRLMSQKADLTVNHDDTLSALMASAGININNVTGHHVIYVSGNVVIDQPVTYANTGGYGSVSNIPSFKLIVSGGDISIISTVSHIDGSYYALPTQAKPQTGTIYTCSDPSQPYKYGLASPEVGSDNFNTCAHQQLVVNGSLAAKQIWLLRSCGTLSDSSTETVGPVFVSGPSGNIHCSATSHAGEVINYDPEVWMSNGGGLDQTSGTYNTIQNLPPVL